MSKGRSHGRRAERIGDKSESGSHLRGSGVPSPEGGAGRSGRLPLARMKTRWGLRAKMTGSYVLFTALAVLAALAVVIGVVAPKVLSVQDLETRARATASGMAATLAVSGHVSKLPPTDLGQPGGKFTLGQAQPDANGGVVIPEMTKGCDPGLASFALLVSTTNTVLRTSYPTCFPVGSPTSVLPESIISSFAQPGRGGGTTSVASRRVVWAAQPVVPSGGGHMPGTLYVQVPASARSSGINPSLVRTGLLLLGLTIPVGILFGLLNTQRLTRRLGRLADSTLEVADGAFDRRISVTGSDEVSRLEENFNRMAERLAASLAAERQLASANARHEERSRIARELHDSISQDLFSLSVLAGGLRKALPADSTVLREVETMERTAGTTIREMQALLLELRPIALDEGGLAPALEQLCRAYRERLGVDVLAELEPLVLPTALEHTMLRVAQEALANAAKHADAGAIRLELHAEDGRVILEVTDNGRGFDPHVGGWTSGLGLQAMRERVSELNGELLVEATPGRGTTVRATVPWAEP
jgi:signal transduction histidine kinase